MPADLTAPQLIALLREHPGACELIELRITKDGSRAYSAEFADLWRDDPPQCIPGFRRWLTGAAVEKHIELDIAFPSGRDGEWVSGPDFGELPPSECKQHPTFLHAAIAALESHAKEKS